VDGQPGNKDKKADTPSQGGRGTGQPAELGERGSLRQQDSAAAQGHRKPGHHYPRWGFRDLRRRDPRGPTPTAPEAPETLAQLVGRACKYPFAIGSRRSECHETLPSSPTPSPSPSPIPAQPAEGDEQSCRILRERRLGQVRPRRAARCRGAKVVT
jgi:hypothetical protein